MIQLLSLNKKVYDQVKKDREILLERIKTSQYILDELDTVFPILDSVFNPKINIRINDRGDKSYYIGIFSFLLPDGTKSKNFTFTIGNVKDYNGIDDEKLLQDAFDKSQKRIKNECPEFFK